MDPIKIEKLQAINKYNRAQFIYKLLHYSIVAYTVCHLFPSNLWVVSLCSSMKLFFLVSIPKFGGFLVGPKCLFFLFNVIVIILVGESKFLGSSSPRPDIYDEYVEKTRSDLKFSIVLEKEKENTTDKLVISEKLRTEEESEKKQGREEKAEEKEEEKKEEKEEEKEEEEEEEEEVKNNVIEDFETEEDNGLATDVLNKRFEDFIARVNKERRREANLMVCGG